MTMDPIPETEPPGAKDSDYWAWYIWFFQTFHTFPTAHYLDYPIAGTKRWINFASREDRTSILISYDSVDM